MSFFPFTQVEQFYYEAIGDTLNLTQPCEVGSWVVSSLKTDYWDRAKTEPLDSLLWSRGMESDSGKNVFPGLNRPPRG